MVSTGWIDTRRLWRRTVAAGLAGLAATWLAACGGGGSSDDGAGAIADPPAAQAVLVDTSAETASGAAAAVDAGVHAVGRAGDLSGLSLLLGDPFALGQANPASAMRRPLAVENAPCEDILETPCSGSATAEYNADDISGVLPAGTFIDIRFAGLTGRLAGNALSFDGRMRLDFNSAYNIDAGTLAGLDVDVTLDALTVGLNGSVFGPTSVVAHMLVDSGGTVAVTVGGQQFVGLQGVTVNGEQDFVIAGGSVKTAYWNDASRHVVFEWQNWRVVDGRPTVGSRITVRGDATTLSLVVTASGPDSVLLDATFSGGGVSTAYTVTVTYPPGGGLPSYTAVPA